MSATDFHARAAQDAADARRLARDRTEPENCLDLVQTRRRLVELAAEHRRRVCRMQCAVIGAGGLGIGLGFILGVML